MTHLRSAQRLAPYMRSHKRAKELAASGVVDIVLTWQIHDSPDEIDVMTDCRTNNIEFLALAQSCAALAE
jgi:hypothetical protein